MTFRVLTNDKFKGRVPSKDRFTLTKNSLVFNDTTRRELNIMVNSYVEFTVTDAPGHENDVFLRFHKTRASKNCLKVGKAGAGNYFVSVPTSARKTVMALPKTKRHKNGRAIKNVRYFKAENYRPSEHRRFVRLTPIQEEENA